MNDTIKFEWVIPKVEAQSELNALVENGALIERQAEPYQPPKPEEADTPFSEFEPLSIITGVVAAAFIIERVVFAAKTLKLGGVIVDLRNGKAEVTPAIQFDAGTIVVVDPNGKTTIHSSATQPLDIISFIKALVVSTPIGGTQS